MAAMRSLEVRGRKAVLVRVQSPAPVCFWRVRPRAPSFEVVVFLQQQLS